MRITIKMKLLLAFGLVIALSAITAVLGITKLATLNDSLDQMVSGPVERLQLSLEVQGDAAGRLDRTEGAARQ
jgi:methyl-accepting chemotaxis protein